MRHRWCRENRMMVSKEIQKEKRRDQDSNKVTSLTGRSVVILALSAAVSLVQGLSARLS